MNKLRIIRESKKLTQYELADLSGVSRNTILLLEKDINCNVQTETLKKLAKTLNIKDYNIFFN